MIASGQFLDGDAIGFDTIRGDHRFGAAFLQPPFQRPREIRVVLDDQHLVPLLAHDVSSPLNVRGATDALSARFIDLEDLAHDRLDRVPGVLVLGHVEGAEGIAARRACRNRLRPVSMTTSIGGRCGSSSHSQTRKPSASGMLMSRIRSRGGLREAFRIACSPFSAVSTSRPSFLQRTESARTTAGSSSAISTFLLFSRSDFTRRRRHASSCSRVSEREGSSPPVGAPECAQGVDQVLGLVGLLDEVGGAGAQRLEARPVGRVGGEDDRRDVARVDGVLQPLEKREAVHDRHAKVEHDGVGRIALRDVEALLAVERHDRLEAGVAQPEPDRPGDLPVVVDDQHASGSAPLKLVHPVRSNESRGLRGSAHKRRGSRPSEPFGRSCERPGSDRGGSGLPAAVRRDGCDCSRHRCRGCGR